MLVWLLLLLPILVIAAFYFIWKDVDPAKVPPTHFPWHISKEDNDTKTFCSKPTEEKVLIIGGGFCGLGIGGALTRYGIPFDIVEREKDIGGNWNHGVYGTVHIISSRITTEYKDFPMPADYPDFPSSKQVLAYLKDYAKNYDLMDHINLNVEVTLAKPQLNEKGEHTGFWEVYLSTGEKRIYKAVIVANGHHWSKRIPSYPGQDTFKGEIIHSKDYKIPSQLENKNILVVGAGNSGCDIAVEAARYGSTSHVSHRRGYWFLPRTIFGIPFVDLIKPWMPLWFQRLVCVFVYRILIGYNSHYGLPEPDHRVFDRHPTINSELLHFIKLGKIAPHGDIEEINEHSVKFGGKWVPIDMIVFATGYFIDLPMFEKDVIDYEDGIPQLISGLISPKFKNLYVFGIGQVRYGAGPLITLGADSLAQVLVTQDKLAHPLGDVLKAMKQAKLSKKSPYTRDVLQDPHTLYLKIKISNFMVSKIPAAEKILMKLNLLK